MSLDPAILAAASSALRGYALDGLDEGRQQAHNALAALILTARSDGDGWAGTRLRRARDLIDEYATAGAGQADLLVGEVSERHR